MAEERWSPVPDYAGWYEASDWGQVYSLPRAAAAGGLLHPKLNSRGYYQVGLCKYGRVTQVLVGRIVLAAFRGPCPPGKRVRYGPRGPADNSLENLRWG
jgi:hypothetical protein